MRQKTDAQRDALTHTPVGLVTVGRLMMLLQTIEEET